MQYFFLMALGDSMTEKTINWARRATILALTANLFLITIKFVVGILVNSVSLVADGFDSTLDIFTAIIAYVGYHLACRPPDVDHHYGHNQLEALLSLGITVLLFLSAFVIFNLAISRLISGTPLEFDILGLLTALISVVTKICISCYVIKAGKLAKSPAIVANGRNYRTDALTSALVIFAMIGSFFSFGWLDAIMALVICIFIFYTGIQITKTSLTSLLDMAPPTAFNTDVLEKIENISGVEEAHNLRLRYLGNTITGDCHILVDPKIPLEVAHEIAEAVKELAEDEFAIKDLIVHLEPFIPMESKIMGK